MIRKRFSIPVIIILTAALIFGNAFAFASDPAAEQEGTVVIAAEDAALEEAPEEETVSIDTEELTAEETTADSEEEKSEEQPDAAAEETAEEDAELNISDEDTSTLKNGFFNEDGTWGWYIDDKLQSTMSGIVKGTINDTLAWYYIRNGIYTKSTGIAKKADGSSIKWFFVKDGVFTKASGLAGRADNSNNTLYYVKNGVYTRATGLCKMADASSAKWYYVENGVFKTATGIAQRADGSNKVWYYVRNGIFTKSTGIAKKISGAPGWFYMENGVFTKATGISLKADHSVDKNWYYVKDGKFNSRSCLARRIDGKNTYLWYMIKGKLNRAYKGGLLYGGKLYSVNNGIASRAAKYTGFVKAGSYWYYYSNGSRTSASGVVKGTVNNTTGWWLVTDGAVDLEYSGNYTSGIRTYSIKSGRAVYCNYYFLDTSIDLPSGGYNLSTANIGIKVVKVNQKLLGSSSAFYTGNTASAVMSFQSSNALPATGVVDLTTWLYMGFSEYDWYNLGSYRTPIKTDGFSTIAELRNAMVSTAYEYAYWGTAYAEGASGAPGSYIDCSGLIFQCLYSIGINPDLNIIDHALAQYEYCSTYLAADSDLGLPVSTADLVPGDLLFYAHTGAYNVVHVAIYAGNGMIYDSWPGIGVSYRSMYIGGYSVVKAVRPV